MSVIPAIVWAAVLAQPVAEEDAAPGRPLEEQIEVVAEAPVAEDVAAFATTLDASELAGRGQDLADLLRRVPGARVRDYGGLGSYATMSLRASTSEQVTVLVDGVPQNRALGGPVDLSSIPATQLERVTVFRGFAPAAYGLGGIGGVVDVRTRPPGADPGARLDVAVGELSTGRLSADLSWPTGEGRCLRIGAEILRSDGDYRYLDTAATPFNPDDDAVRLRANNDTEQEVALLQHAWSDVSGGPLRLGIRLQQRDRGVPGLDGSVSGSARLDETLQELNVAWSRRGGRRIDEYGLSLDGFRQRIGFRDIAGEIGLGAQDQTTRLEGAGVGGIVRAALGGHRLLLRLDSRYEEASVRDAALELADRGGAERTRLAATVEDLTTVGPVTFAPSVRWEHRRDDFHAGASGTLAPAAADVGDDAWSGKLGIAYRLGHRSRLRGSVGRFHRVPNLLELFGDRGAVVGNPELRPEQGVALELGYSSSRRPRSSLSIAGELVGFARRSEDLIHFLPVSQGAAVAQNVSDVDVAGLEAAISLGWGRSWSLDASGTLQDATDRSNGFSRNRPLPYQPAKLGYLGAAWSGSGTRVRWDLTYTGSNSTDVLDTPELRLPSRVIHDVYLSHAWRGGLSIGIDVRNLFDRRTIDLLRYPLPGRVLLAHVGWRHGDTSP